MARGAAHGWGSNASAAATPGAGRGMIHLEKSGPDEVVKWPSGQVVE